MRISVIAVIGVIAASTMSAADAQVTRHARENAAGGVSVGATGDVRGPLGGRAVAERGVVTNGDGGGLAGRRGCANGAAGGQGCSSGATVWDRNGNVAHESGAVFEGPLGARGSTYGGFTRDADGNVSGSRNSTVDVGNRSYSAESTFESGEGLERSVTCTGSSCRK